MARLLKRYRLLCAAAIPLAATLLAVVLAAGEAPAEPVLESCIMTTRVQTITYVDDRTLNFIMRNGTIYQNHLRAQCRITRYQGFAYRTMTGHLCKGDMIRAIGHRQACSLGQFERMEHQKT